MLATLSEFGNQHGFTVSEEILKELDLAVGDQVNIYQESNKIIIEPAKKRELYIEELVKKLPKELASSEEFSIRVGREEW